MHATVRCQPPHPEGEVPGHSKGSEGTGGREGAARSMHPNWLFLRGILLSYLRPADVLQERVLL